MDVTAQRADTHYARGVEGTDSAYSAPDAATLTKIYNHFDQPTQLLFRDLAGFSSAVIVCGPARPPDSFSTSRTHRRCTTGGRILIYKDRRRPSLGHIPDGRQTTLCQSKIPQRFSVTRAGPRKCFALDRPPACAQRSSLRKSHSMRIRSRRTLQQFPTMPYPLNAGHTGAQAFVKSCDQVFPYLGYRCTASQRPETRVRTTQHVITHPGAHTLPKRVHLENAYFPGSSLTCSGQCRTATRSS